MRKKILKLSLLISVLSFGQTNTGNVGINTISPKANLHVNGNMQVTKDLSFGGDGSTKGNSGTAGQILISSNEGKSPKWLSSAEVKVPEEVAFLKSTTKVSMPYNRMNTNIPFDKTQILKTDFITVITDVNGKITGLKIVKPGNYQINSFSSYHINSILDTSGYYRNLYLNFFINGIDKSGYNTRCSFFDQSPMANLIYIGYFKTNDVINLRTTIQQNVLSGYFDLLSANIGVQFLGN